MRTAPDRPENYLLDEEPPKRDLVLGLPALLGIFLAVALICAVCFGFGYSSSHRIQSPPRQLAAAVPETRPEPVPMPSPEPAEDNPAESAYPTPAPQAGPEVPAPQPQPTRRALKPTPGITEQAPSESSVPAQGPVAEQEARPLPALSQQSPALAGAGLMVQIAAVTRAADAQTLANALRHDGFDAVVRTATEDRYFHVQIGPFSSAQAAKAVRTRLADSGYNAFIKP